MEKDLAALYPPYDKVTRGDVIAGRLKGMKGKKKGKKKAMKKKLQKEWSVYHQLGFYIAEALRTGTKHDPEEAERFGRMSGKQLKSSERSDEPFVSRAHARKGELTPQERKAIIRRKKNEGEAEIRAAQQRRGKK